MNSSAPTMTDRAYGVYAWITACLIVIPWMVIIVLLPRLAWRRQAARLGANMLLTALLIPVDSRGIKNLNGQETCVVVANHASYLDGVILTAVLPPDFTFVIKREITKVPIVSLLLRRLGSEFVERFDQHSSAADARRVLRRASRREALGFFPEGTFKPTPGLRGFRLGAFVAAARAGMPVVPVAIRGARQILPAKRWLPSRGAVEVEVLMPLVAEGNGGTAARQLRDRAREAILARCGEPDLLVG